MMNKNKLTIPRDFIFNKDAIISYYENLQQFEGNRLTQSKIAHLLKLKFPDSQFYNSLDRKFATLKFYGFLYYEQGVLKFNSNFKNYVDCLKKESSITNSFLDILMSSKFSYYENSKSNFFDLMISLMQDETILYIDLIDVITYLQHYDIINDVDELKNIIKNNRSLNFAEKVIELEEFYESHSLGDIAAPLHEANKYLFSFLQANGFYTVKNSLQSKVYFQKDGTSRMLEDRRLYLSEELLSLVHGYDNEAIIDEVEYNSEIDEIGFYDESSLQEIKLIEQSKETVKSISRRYKTDKKLRNTALFRTSYTCEIAILKGEEHSTFTSKSNNKEYAEVHHLVPMHAQENEYFVQNDKLISLDQIPNLIVLCPTCHRKIHFGHDLDVKPDLELLFDGRQEALKKHKLNIEIEHLLDFYKISI
jgi:predicted HNH restriction endonuclease